MEWLWWAIIECLNYITLLEVVVVCSCEKPCIMVLVCQTKFPSSIIQIQMVFQCVVTFIMRLQYGISLQPVCSETGALAFYVPTKKTLIEMTKLLGIAQLMIQFLEVRHRHALEINLRLMLVVNRQKTTSIHYSFFPQIARDVNRALSSNWSHVLSNFTIYNEMWKDPFL